MSERDAVTCMFAGRLVSACCSPVAGGLEGDAWPCSWRALRLRSLVAHLAVASSADDHRVLVGVWSALGPGDDVVDLDAVPGSYALCVVEEDAAAWAVVDPVPLCLASASGDDALPSGGAGPGCGHAPRPPCCPRGEGWGVWIVCRPPGCCWCAGPTGPGHGCVHGRGVGLRAARFPSCLCGAGGLPARAAREPSSARAGDEGQSWGVSPVLAVVVPAGVEPARPAFQTGALPC